MYCVKCGVELEEHQDRCPLCKTKVPEYINNENFIEEYPMININFYKLKVNKIKKAVFMSFFTISLISILEIFFQNIIIYGSIKWGYYAIPSILLFDLFLFVFLNSYKMRMNLMLILIGLVSFLLIIDYGNGEITWSLKRGMPIVITFYLLSFIFSFVWDKHKKERIKILNFFIFFVGIFLLILEIILKQKCTWSIWASIPLFVLNIMLRYTYRAYKEEFERRLHL